MRKKNTYPLILIILLGPFIWFLNLKKDSWKLAISLAMITNGALFLLFAHLAASDSTPTNPDNFGIVVYLFATFLLSCYLIITWAWAIADTGTRYEGNSPAVTAKNQTWALLLAIFFGAWTWLYTYRNDWWKLIPGLIIGYGVFIARLLVSKGDVFHYINITALLIWLLAIIDVAIRGERWYKAH